MTFTYDAGSAPTTTLAKIRIEIGDTDSNDPLLTDEEVAYVTGAESDFWVQCAKCCDLICAKIARDVDHKWGSSSESSSDIYKHYAELAKAFRGRGSASYPWSKSVSKDDKDAIEEDMSLIEPLFKRGMHDNN